MPVDLSVVICAFNGAPGVRRCLTALGTQTIRARMEIIVVDDGSADDTSEVARAHGAVIVRHPENRGIAAARNSGVRAASAPIVAFLDDDCEPEPQWAERLLACYGEDVMGVGGPLLPEARPGFMLGYLKRHNPLDPLELNLANSDNLLYRFFLYLRRQWAPVRARGARAVYSLAGANMSFRRSAVIAVGNFDERFRFGAEEVDLCQRMVRAFPGDRLLFIPEARVVHHFEPTVRDTLRRSRAYGRGSARLYRKWPLLSPTFFPGPVAVAGMLALCTRFPELLVAPAIMPQLLYPQGPRDAVTRRRLTCLLDSYVQLAQEACEDVGFIEGMWRFRHLVPEPRNAPVRGAESSWAPEPGP